MSSVQQRERRVGVLLGGLSAERDISLESGRAVLEALRRRGFTAEAIDAGRGVCRELTEAGIEVAFIALHGRYGEDGCVQGLLETMAIPYTGSGVAASAIAMDKLQCKRLMQSAALPTPGWCYPATAVAVSELGLPAVIKPRREGSSVGLTVVRQPDGLEPAIAAAGGAEQALAERHVAGRELSVAVLGRGAAARCLGTVEIRPASGLYDFTAKYQRDDTAYLVPAPVPGPVGERLEQLALALHRLVGCRGATRTDLIWDGQSEPLLLEINTIPGMTSHSLLPKIAAAAGLGYDDLVEAMLAQASLEEEAPQECEGWA